MSIVKIDKNFGGTNLMIKKRISKRIISCFMLCALMISSIMGFAITSNAASENNGKVYYVGTPQELHDAAISTNDGDCIVFTNDIVCYESRYVHKNITIDFNNHSLKFRYKSRGLCIDASWEVTLKNGAIYGANDSDSAVRIIGGNLNLQCMQIYGGDCKWGDYHKGNGIYSWSMFSKIRMKGCYVKGGDGYKKHDSNDNRTGKAIYGGKVIKEGMGYIAVDGICK